MNLKYFLLPPLTGLMLSYANYLLVPAPEWYQSSLTLGKKANIEIFKQILLRFKIQDLRCISLPLYKIVTKINF